jgi:hypothetical protein
MPYTMAVFTACLLLVCIVALYWSSSRARELGVVSVRRGRVLLLRGALPSSLLDALADIGERGQVRSGTIWVLRDGERARLTASGLDEFSLQRARNVLGTYPMTKLLSAPRPRARNMGQRLGIAWLGWWLQRRK